MKELEIFKADTSLHIDLSFADAGIRAGFPTPAQEYLDNLMDLNDELIQHPASTFLAKVVGLSMIDAGIDEGDILVIDRSLEPLHDNIIVAYIDEEFTTKRLDLSQRHKGKIYLRAANKDYPDLCITPNDKFKIWGVVSYIIKQIDNR